MPFILAVFERSNSWAGRPPAVSLYATCDDAKAGLVAYVKKNWESELGDAIPEAGDEELIEQYFEEVLEDYSIQEVDWPLKDLGSS